jgi:signal transduction histidine kinase
MLIKGITRRWLFNSMGVIFTILAVLWIFFALVMRSYYYNSVTQNITAIATIDSNNFSNLISPRISNAKIDSNNIGTLVSPQSPDFNTTAKKIVEGYLDKDKMELMILDKNGNVKFTSSGFMPASLNIKQDFSVAIASINGIGEWDGYNPETGEKIMGVTKILHDIDGQRIGAARYVVSLSNVDMQIAFFILISGLICIAIILFVVMSGTYFVNSIVVPVREIGQTARRIASGDFGAKIDKQYDDEIGELCDTINFMAGELDAADRMKNDFISSVSHELRTPLTAIQGWGETMLSSGPDDKELLIKGMGVIIEETGRLSTMVEELLDFSRIQSGRFKLMLERVDVLAELGEAVIMFSDRAKRETLTFSYVEAEILPPVLGDRNKLKQVFVNILDNAFKYSNKGGDVTVETMDNTDSINIIISDTGCGISDSDLPFVKQRFFKGNSTRRGNGIGLAVSEEIINLHGGVLDISSEEGKGTVVTITLPTCPKANLDL